MSLDEYLKQNKITETAFAASIGVHQSSVHRLRKGAIMPDIQTLAKIIEVTEGAVTLGDFVPASDPPLPFPAPGGAAEDERGAA